MHNEPPTSLTTAAPDMVRRYFTTIAIVWTLLIASLYIWGIFQTSERTDEILLSQARPFFKQIVVTRSWNARHGGVYVPITRDNPPNPYLDVPNRDIETTKGTKLTLVNPAYMTRQIAELAMRESNIIFHLTSDKPIRPANAPEPWEHAALGTFNAPGAEFSKRWQNEQGKTFFRYMAPLWVEKPCLQCHARQGYKEGDLRGGLSITIPAEAVIGNEHQSIAFQGGAFTAIWFFGLVGLSLASREIRHRAQEQESLIHRLKNTLQGLVPICASCKSIRNDSGEWEKLEHYIANHSEAEFSHGICPECANEMYPGYIKSSDKND